MFIKEIRLIYQKRVNAIYSNNSKKLLAVVWESDDVNTDEIGTYTFWGKVNGYTKKVKLTLKVNKRNLVDAKLSGKTFNDAYYNSESKSIIRGVEYGKGFSLGSVGVFENKGLVIYLEGKYTRLTGKLGIDDNWNQTSPTKVSFYGDDILLDEYIYKPGNEPTSFDLELTDVKDLKILVNVDFGNYIQNISFFDTYIYK